MNMQILSKSEKECIEGARPSPRIVVYKATGFLSGAGAEAMVKFLRESVAINGPNKITVFNDWIGVTDYETSARKLLMSSADELRPHIKCSHVLVGSKLVSMGVAVSARLLGDALAAHTDRARFYRLIERTAEAVAS